MVNHFYVYCVDRDFGPFFLKFCTYFPYNANATRKTVLLMQRPAYGRGIDPLPVPLQNLIPK